MGADREERQHQSGVTTMDQTAFRAELERGGFNEIETRSIAPNVYNPPHSHAFEVRALMLTGELTLAWEDQQHTFVPGEIFVMAAGCEHTEWFGPEGASYLVGRKHRAAA
jgi:quercetin dioxygenase-like cupin family protein